MVQDFFLAALGKSVSFLSRSFGGGGATWPGHLVLRLDPAVFRRLERGLKKGSVLITGTNGKTTTAGLLKTILEAADFKVAHNSSGANLLNGIASALILDSTWRGRSRAEVGVFEVDEGHFPLALGLFLPAVVVLLNLSRDQLDRYGEIDLILERWEAALLGLARRVKILINSDEPQFARLFRRLTEAGCNLQTFNLSRPDGLKSPLAGAFNRLNTQAAGAAALALGVEKEVIGRALASFRPAFGRGERLSVKGKKVEILLAKNPASFNANLALLRDLGAEGSAADAVLFVLNDRIPDGRDVSWIYDIDFESHADWLGDGRLVVSGRRFLDLALRLKYAAIGRLAIGDLKRALGKGLEKTAAGGTLYILPTYSAMLEVRKLLTGRRIN